MENGKQFLLQSFAHRPAKGAERNAFERRANEIIDRDEFMPPGSLPWKVTDLTHEQMEAILLDVAGGRSILRSARENGTSLFSVMCQRVAHKEFGDAMNLAIQMRNGLLEEKAFELAYDGQTQTVAKGDAVYEHTEYPTAALLQFLLKAVYPEKYGIERREIKAGPLDTPPEMIRDDKDRIKLAAKIENRAREREALMIAVEDDFSELL